MEMRTLYFTLMSLLFITTSYSKNLNVSEERTMMVYNTIEHDTIELPDYKIFKIAYEGYLRLGSRIKNEKLTIVDFNKSSKRERLWVFDIKNNKLLYKSLVCHGSGSGSEYATRFSNITGSNMSSLGFYITDNSYIGKKGLALRLDGVDYGLNSNVRDRAVVVHSAKYAKRNVNTGYLGRSQGCLALPVGINNIIISTIKNKSCIFVFNDSYLNPPRKIYKNKKKRR